MKGKKITVKDLAIVGLMAAMVFVSTMFLSIRIPTPTGQTMLKVANAICLLSGLLFGGFRGGMAAGLGSFLYDLTDPRFISGAPITFINFFIMGCVCGLIAHHNGNKPTIGRCIGASCAGAFTYTALYLGKKIITLTMAGSTFSAAAIAITPNAIASVTNAVFGVVVACLLVIPVRNGLIKAKIIK